MQKRPMYLKQCECGCGLLINKVTNACTLRRYANGHNQYTPEMAKNIITVLEGHGNVESIASALGLTKDIVRLNLKVIKLNLPETNECTRIRNSTP